MKLINVRSPFNIVVDEIGQAGGKIHLHIYNKGQSEPVIPTYELSKLIPSPTQTELVWNISKFLKDKIEIINPIKVNATTEEQNSNWVFCKIDRYKLEGSIYTFLDATTYVAVAGFGLYLDGNQVANETLFKVLKNKLIDSNYHNVVGQSKYVNIIIDKLADKNLFAIYERNDGVSYTVVQNLLTSQSGIFNLKIPLSLKNTDGNFANGCRLTLSYQTSGAPILNVFNTYPIDECKYTPVECSFINSYGGWEFLTFFKAQTNSFAVKSTEYNISAEVTNYNPLIGQSKAFNINGTSSIKLNTGFVDEDNGELINNLMLSEVVLLDNKPVTVKSQSLTYKTHLKDKNINYELEFDFAFDLINNA